MPRSAGLLAFPEFSGFTRKLILWNLGAYFFLILLHLASANAYTTFVIWAALLPPSVFHGAIWQFASYSFIHTGILDTAFQLLSLWFLCSFLEGAHGWRWWAVESPYWPLAVASPSAARPSAVTRTRGRAAARSSIRTR